VTGEQQTLPNLGPAPLVVGPVFVCFELAGKPGHKARHRSRIVFPKGSKKAFIHNYPDPDTEAYEKILAEVAALFMGSKAPTDRPVALLVHSFRPIPQSWSNRDKEAALAGAILPTPRPDWDNYGKITDALNKIVWDDDSQVCDGRVIKRYSERPALRIEVREFVTLTNGE
jgi:Holliday junction resolvase RusA-like endonuclease